MNQGVVDWVRAATPPEIIRGKRLLDVGSLDWNGSMRRYFEEGGVSEYHGIDILEGPGVDEILSAENLVPTHGAKRWDIVLCLEMLEHAEHWQECLYQMKESLVEGGWLFITTRSPGFGYHAGPDYWRFPKSVLRYSLGDMEDVATWSDPGFMGHERWMIQHGVFARARHVGEVRRIMVDAEPAPPPIDPVMEEIISDE